MSRKVGSDQFKPGFPMIVNEAVSLVMFTDELPQFFARLQIDFPIFATIVMCDVCWNTQYAAECSS